MHTPLTSQVQTGLQPDLVHLSDSDRRVLHTIGQAGGTPRLVGGSVRDALMGQHQPKDIDIEVYGDIQVDTLVTALSHVGLVNEVGRSYGVLKVRSGHTDYDVSLPRRDSKIAAGHRGFSVVADAGLSERDAAARRDFTINSIMWDPQSGAIIDPWGGAADLRAGVLRHTSSAFSEDPLRVLRGVQFAARFGFVLADDTAAVCRQLAGSYRELATERVWGEWEKLLTRGTHIKLALHQLQRSGWDRHYPELTAMYGVRQDTRWHPEGDVFEHTGLAADQAAQIAQTAGLADSERLVIVAAALLHDTGKPTTTKIIPQPDGTRHITAHGHADAGVEPTKQFLQRIGAPREIIERTVPLVREHMAAVTTPTPTPAAVRRLARRLLPSTIQQWALLVHADRQGRAPGGLPSGTVDSWTQIAQSLHVQEHPAPNLLRGDHLIAAGLKPGRSFSVILRVAQQAQDGNIFTDEAGAERWLQNYLADPTEIDV
jgi:tRNA nucleotidyltransferase (CCA-adding enzyme)